MTPSDLTIVIPTYERHDRLRRALRYLAEEGAGSPVLVLDSSASLGDEAGLREDLEAAGAEYERFDPDTAPYAKMRDGLAQVATPYAVLWGDDDMLVAPALQEAAALLEADPALGIAHGPSTIATLREAGGRPEMVALDEYAHADITDASAAERLITHLAAYSTTFYSVHRTPALQHAFDLTVEHGFGHYWGEYFLSAMSVVSGRTGCVDRLYMVRECHQGMDSVNTTGSRVDFFDFTTQPTYADAYARFRDSLAEEVARVDGIGVEEARATVKKAWWAHLALGLAKKYEAEYAVSPPGVSAEVKRQVKRRLKTAPLLGALLTRGQAAYLRARPGGPLSLSAMLDASSPYHDDFMPVYSAMTGAASRR